MKCLPQKSIARAQGVVLHDWHAEILAIRSFNRFLLEECYALASSPGARSSEYVRLRHRDERSEKDFQPFALVEGISLHMYCSEAPCTPRPHLSRSRCSTDTSTGGDASMELTIAAQEDPTPWDLPPMTPIQDSPPSAEAVLHGRGYFSDLGAIRRKPSRPDAPPTLSKSCSDKIALKQSTSLLSSVASLLISPSNVYIHSLVLPTSQHSPVACARAFSRSGRLSPLANKEWEGGYAFRPFNILTTEKDFPCSRRQPLQPGQKMVPSNIATSWTPNHSDTLIGGGLQGRKQFSLKGASRVCKRRTWKLALDVAALVSVQAPEIERALRVDSYALVKQSDLLQSRWQVKADVRADALKGWVRNVGGEEWGVDGVES